MSLPNMVEFSSLLRSLQAEFGEDNIRSEELNPWSTWFSYGSNLYNPNFESKMREHGSNLSLLCPLRSTLRGYERKLDNESTRRGLAYALHELNATNGFENPKPVEGIIHNVPVADLPAFLQFEGVLDESCKVKKAEGEEKTEKKPKGKRRYDIKKVTVKVYSEKDPTNCLGCASCFTLLGSSCSLVPKLDMPRLIKANYAKIVEYVLTAMKGAVCFRNDPTPFQENLHEIALALVTSDQSNSHKFNL